MIYSDYKVCLFEIAYVVTFSLSKMHTPDVFCVNIYLIH